MIKIKESFQEELIYIPIIKTTMVGKFIPKSLYKHLYSKYPDLFEFKSTKEKDK